MTHTQADLELAEWHVAEGERRIAELRAMIATRVRIGSDARQSESVLDNFQIALRLMFAHRDQLVRELRGSR
jgi:hypothetical protein